MSLIFTLGHSTRQLAEFTGLLHSHAVSTLADVRRYPGSRRYPHFSRESLQQHLAGAGIVYLHLPELGGRREATPDSPNTAWKNAQFRGYADHMASPEFRGGIGQLLAAKAPAAIMCAEAVPWRCHRQLIADELVRRGISVVHILDLNATRPHEMNPGAVDRGTHLEYPAPRTKLF